MFAAGNDRVDLQPHKPRPPPGPPPREGAPRGAGAAAKGSGITSFRAAIRRGVAARPRVDGVLVDESKLKGGAAAQPHRAAPPPPGAQQRRASAAAPLEVGDSATGTVQVRTSLDAAVVRAGAGAGGGTTLCRSTSLSHHGQQLTAQEELGADGLATATFGAAPARAPGAGGASSRSHSRARTPLLALDGGGPRAGGSALSARGVGEVRKGAGSSGSASGSSGSHSPSPPLSVAPHSSR